MYNIRSGFRRVDEHIYQGLANSVMPEEVRTALFDMQPAKSPGVDGFHAFFFQQNWDVMESLRNQRCSAFWRGLSMVWDIVRSNIVWNLGDGSTVEFWHDAWAGELGPLRMLCSPQLQQSMPHILVRDMVTSDGA
ncbi:hypothetical protein V6N13_026330 [Hibiscus sabdariffa]